MRREELQAANELPAKKLEVQLESPFTQRILDDVGQEPGNLPLLEFALTATVGEAAKPGVNSPSLR
jgi:hypothetical protein